MGPRSDERGNLGTALAIVGLGHPSMGPRSDERGNKPCKRRRNKHEGPSMGPRSDERGNGHTVILQAATECALQWGRAQMSAEMNRCVDGRYRTHAFNGAALR